MTPVRRALLVAGIGGLAASAGYLAHLWRIGGLGGAQLAPDIARLILEHRLTTLDGTPQTLEKFRGQILIINYWATWCGPCREEVPLFVRLQQEYAAKGVQFVGIAIDQADKIRDFALEFRINYPLFIGGLDSIELSRKAGNKAGVLPYTLVLDRAGHVVASLVGDISEVRMRAQLAPLV